MAEENPDIVAARERMKAKFGGAAPERMGGKGSARRKKKVVHKTTGGDDKKVQSALKRLGVNPIPGIEEVNMFMEDSSVVHFRTPKVAASLNSNTYVISGTHERKPLEEMLTPEMLSQIGPQGLQQLQQQFQQMQSKGAAAEGDDDDIPDLVDNFEEVSEK